MLPYQKSDQTAKLPRKVTRRDENLVRLSISSSIIRENIPIGWILKKWSIGLGDIHLLRSQNFQDFWPPPPLFAISADLQY